MSNFLSGTAILLSAISLAFSGFTTYQLFEQQQKIGSFESTINSLESKLEATANLSQQSQSDSVDNLTPEINVNSPSKTTTTTPIASQTSDSIIEFQPGELVKPIGKGKGELELVSIKRVPNPDTNKRDLVLVKMNVRCFDYTQSVWSIGLYNFSVTVSNPETYDKYNFIGGTGTINMSQIAKGTTAGAFVKIQIPENINLVDIFIQDVEAFKNVSIPS